MADSSYRPVAQEACICAGWPDRKIVPLVSETATFLEDEFTSVRERNPWLSLVRCRGCGQAWYAAVDTVDDDIYLRRLTPGEVEAIEERCEWPADYDGFVNVWPEAEQPWRARLERPWRRPEPPAT